MPNNLVSGFYYFISGFGLISKPGMKRFLILPIIINILVFAILYFIGQYYIEKLNLWVTNLLPTWLEWLQYGIWFLFMISFIAVFIYFFVAITMLIAAPFNEMLAEKTIEILTGVIPSSFGFLATLRDVPRIVARQCSLLFWYLSRAILLFILFFIPVIQLAAPFLWLLFNAWFLTINFIDFAAGIDRVSWQTMYAWLKKNNWTALGFGLCVLFGLMVPVLNFFVMVAAVAGATKFWVVEFRHQKNSSH